MITRVSEKEYWVGTNKTFLIEENVIFTIASGEQTDELAIAQEEVCGLLEKQIKGDLFYLIDVNNCGKNSPTARKTWHRLSEEDKTMGVAVFGIHPVAKVIAAFVIGMSKKNNMQFFKTKEESISWINNLKNSNNK